MEIKQIKALLGLIQFDRKGYNSHRAYIPFRTIFRACNSIRESDVMRRLSKKLIGRPIKVATGQTELIDEFRMQIPKFKKLIRKNSKPLLKNIKKINPKIFDGYIKKKKSALRQYLYPRPLQRHLHYARKLLKEIHYLETIKKKDKKRKTFYKESAALIGDWHDRVVFIERLRKQLPPQTEMIKKLQLQNRTDIRRLRISIKEYYHI